MNLRRSRSWCDELSKIESYLLNLHFYNKYVYLIAIFTLGHNNLIVGRHMKVWYLSHCRKTKAIEGLCKWPGSPSEALLLAYIKYG